MRSFFNYDGPIFQFMSRIFDMMYLNALCLLSCIPIVTIGPSVTALYYCYFSISMNQDSSIVKMFFHSFKSNLKQGVLLTLIFIGLMFFLIIDIYLCSIPELATPNYFRIVLYILCIILSMVVSYTFPQLAQFKNTINNLLRNSLLMSIGNLGYTLAIVFFNAIPWILLFLFPIIFMKTLPFWLFFGFSAIAWINSKIFIKIFSKYGFAFQKN